VLLPLTLNSLSYRPFRFVGVTFTADILTMVVSIILVTAINYLIGKLIVFRKSRKPKEEGEQKADAGKTAAPPNADNLG